MPHLTRIVNMSCARVTSSNKTFQMPLLCMWPTCVFHQGFKMQPCVNLQQICVPAQDLLRCSRFLDPTVSS